MSQCYHKVGQPEKHEDIIELEEDEVFVIGRLTSVEGKEAASIWALFGDVGGIKCLDKEEERHA